MGVVVVGGGNSSYIPPAIQTTPERPSINVPFKVSSLVTTGRTTFAIATDGKLYGWGYNANNILTHYETPETSAWDRGGTFSEILAPYHISEVGKVKSLEISGSTVYAITEDNRLYAWGYNGYGEVGNDSRDVYSEYAGGVATPYEVTQVGKVKSLKISGDTAYAITEDGKLYAWGSNYYGQVGNGRSGYNAEQTTPYEVTSIIGKVKSLEINGSTVYAITEEGKLYAWGNNKYGQVGNGSTGTQTIPYEVTSIVGKVKSLETNGNTVYAITEEGKLYELGPTPTEVTGIVGKVKSVRASVVKLEDYFFSTFYAITEDNRLYAWGYNEYGKVGNGSTSKQTTPYEVTSVGKVKSLKVYDVKVYSSYHGSTVYAITEDNRLYAWGGNRAGEVGNGSTGTQTTPYEVTSVGKVKSLEVYDRGYGSTVYAITEEGKLYAWGLNEYGEVGNGSTSTQTIPYELTSIVGKVKSVVTNNNNTVYAITEEGKLYAWGNNYSGQVGDGYYYDTVTTPYYISEVKQFLE